MTTSTATTPHLDKLNELRQAHLDALKHARTIPVDRRAAHRKFNELRQRRLDALTALAAKSQTTSSEVDTLNVQLAEAKTAVEDTPWGAVERAAQTNVRRADEAITDYVRANLSALVAELRPGAEAARDAVVAAAETWGHALDAYSAALGDSDLLAKRGSGGRATGVAVERPTFTAPKIEGTSSDGSPVKRRPTTDTVPLPLLNVALLSGGAALTKGPDFQPTKGETKRTRAASRAR